MVFKLHDTYGFPVELTKEIASENNISIDDEGFQIEMKNQKEMAREAHKARKALPGKRIYLQNTDKTNVTEFVGYTDTSSESKVQYIIVNNELTDNSQQDDDATLILDRTPFYAESGGQTGDSGIIINTDFKMEVSDCQKLLMGNICI